MVTILQLLGIVAFPIVIAIVIALLNRANKKVNGLNKLFKHIVIGIIFGGTAVLATHYGVDIGHGVKINVRDASPLIAGLMFSPLSGIIAGLIGGIERIFVGGYTVVACTVGTIFSGLFGAGLRHFIFRKKPNFVFCGLTALVCEVFHMLMVFVSHLDNITEAYNKVIKLAAIPMIVGVVVGVMICAIIVELVSGQYHHLDLKKKTISNQYMKAILLVVLLAFIASFVFNAYVQNEEAYSSAISEMDSEIEDIKGSINTNILTIAENVMEELEWSDEAITNESLMLLEEKYNLSEICIIGSDGVILWSTVPSDVGYDMHTSEQSSKFLTILNDRQPVVADFEAKGNGGTLLKYAGIYYDGGILQVAYQRYLFEESITDVVAYRHLGTQGFVTITTDYRTSYQIISNEAKRTETTLDDFGLEAYFLEETEPVEITLNDITYLVKNELVDGYYIIAWYAIDDIVEARNVSLYLQSFLQIISYTIIFGIIYFLSKFNVTNKVEIINEALDQLTKGNTEEKINIKGCVEFESLSTNINNAVDALKQITEEQQKRLQKELDFARSIQLSALPNGNNTLYSTDETYRLHALMHPAVEVGGDFYDYYYVGKDRFVITVADVSGKSFPAAMFMMQSKAIIKSLVQKGLSIDDALTQANNELCAANEAGMFLTLFAASIDLRSGVCEIVNAGHNAQLLSHDDVFEYLKLEPGFIVGGIDGFQYKKTVIQLHPGDTFVLYTDGITEALNNTHELYGEERLINFLNSKKFKDTTDICDSIVENVNEFADGAPQADDMTLLAFKYQGTIRKKAITVDAIIENITKVTEYTNNILASYKIDKKIIGQIDIAIDELFGNICKYSYGDKVGKASLVVEVDEQINQLTITFIDQGMKYNPLDLEDPDIDLPLELREIGGLGIYIVKQSMDEVTYEYKNKNNILKITKSLL